MLLLQQMNFDDGMNSLGPDGTYYHSSFFPHLARNELYNSYFGE